MQIHHSSGPDMTLYMHEDYAILGHAVGPLEVMYGWLCTCNDRERELAYRHRLVFSSFQNEKRLVGIIA